MKPAQYTVSVKLMLIILITYSAVDSVCIMRSDAASGYKIQI